MSQLIGRLNNELPEFEFVTNPAVPEPITRAANQFLGAFICDITAGAEAGYRALGLLNLANQLAVGRSQASCYITPPEDFTSTPNVNPTLPGGQCDGVEYNITAQVTVQGFGPVAQGLVVLGPIGDFFIGPDTDGQGTAIFLEAGERTTGNRPVRWGESGGDNIISGVQVIGLGRVDGLPDECGIRIPPPNVFPPGIELPVAPEPGGELVPITPVEIEILIDNQPTPITIEVGPTTFEPGVGICMPTGGFPIQIRPDGSIIGDLIGGVTDLAGDALGVTTTTVVGGQVAILSNQLQCVIQNVCRTYSGTHQVMVCDGSTSVEGYSGFGLESVLDSLEALSRAINAQTSQLCPASTDPPENVAESLLSDEVISLTTNTGTPVMLSEMTVQVRVEFTPPSEWDGFVRGIGEGNVQGRYGQILFGQENGGEISWFDAINAYFSSTVANVPMVRRGNVYIRVSSAVGMRTVVFDTGLRR